MTKALHRFRGELIAFWYCNRSAIGLILCAFVTFFLIMPLPPGNGIRAAGIIFMVAVATVIVFKPRNLGENFLDSQERLKHEIHALWLKEEPWWSPPLMLIFLLLGLNFFVLKPEVLKDFFMTFFH